MRGLKYVCYTCRYLQPTPPLNLVPKRNAHFSKTEPYILPRLVIDLDDANSKFVRKAEDLEDAELESDLPISQSQTRSVPLKRTGVSKTRVNGKSPISSLVKATPPDLLTYALIGDPDKRKPTNYRRIGKRLGYIYAYHSIHPSESVETKVQIMSLENSSTQFTSDGFDLSRYSTALAQLAKCREINAIQQIVSLLCLTDSGCQLLAINGESLEKGLRSCPKSQHPDVVIFLNNLVHNMNSKGIEIGSSICNAGLYYACRTWNLTAARIYLDILDRNLYDSDKNTRGALFVLRMALDGMKRGESQSLYGGQFSMEEGLHFLTGHQGVERLQPANGQTASFASLARRDITSSVQYNLYTSYILSLGELGLGDYLQSEWGSSEIPALLHNDDKTKSLLFGVAFLLADQRERALSVLKNLMITSASQDSAVSRPESSGNMIAIINMVYKMHRVEPSEKLQSLMQTNLSVAPDDPEEALAFLDFFLTINAPRFEQFDGGSPLTVDCAEIDGGACLFVMPRKSQTSSEALYLKSQSFKPGILSFN